ncbi:hypothetical protein BGZ93_007940, partial [Podila epicladia]
MDNNDVGYSSVAWDTYTPGNDDDSRGGENGHNNPYSKNHNSLFASSDEDDDDDLADITAMAASSTIIPAETSAWADEPLDNEVIDIHGSGVLRSTTTTTTTTTTSTSGSAGGKSAGSTLNQNSSFGGEDEDDNDEQVHRSHAPGKAVKRDHVRTQSDMSLSTSAAERLAKLVPMEITVTDAHREKEGSSDSFISYQVNTK